MGKCVFKGYGDNELNIYCKPVTVPQLDPSEKDEPHDLFLESNNVIIHVRHDAVNSYKGAWSNVKDQIYGDLLVPNQYIKYTSTDGNIIEPYRGLNASNNDITLFGANIVSNTYENGQGIIIFSNNVIKIGYEAFDGCNRLTSITIPDSVTVIGEGAFAYCSSLTSITIPDSVTSIGASAFYYCRSLTSVTIGNSVTSIGDFAFVECTNLTSFYGLRASSDNRCVVLKNVLKGFAPKGISVYEIPSNIKKIENGVFGGCVNLTEVILSDQIEDIGVRAFSNCNKLKNINIPISVTKIGE